MNIKSFTLGYLTALTLSLGVVVADARLNYDDQSVNRSEKANRLDYSEPVRKNQFAVSGDWTLHKVERAKFCYLTHKKYPGLTVTPSALTFTMKDDGNHLTYVDKFVILNSNGEVTRKYTRDVGVSKIADQLFYYIQFEPVSRRDDIKYGWWLKLNEHKFKLDFSQFAIVKMMECTIELEE